MGKLTLKTVNKAIADKGIKAELVQSKGYLYFIGEDVELAYTTSVCVPRLNRLSLEQWMFELDLLVIESKGVIP